MRFSVVSRALQFELYLGDLSLKNEILEIDSQLLSNLHQYDNLKRQCIQIQN